MRLLALDQSSKITGWAYFKDGILEEYGKFEAQNEDIKFRLAQIQNRVADLIDKYEIEKVVIEDIQLQSNNNNVVTYKVLAFVMAAIMMLCGEMNIPCETMASSTWKSQCGIKGRTRVEQKRDAQRFVQEDFGIKATQDTTDAICIGVAYLKKQGSELNWA